MFALIKFFNYEGQIFERLVIQEYLERLLGYWLIIIFHEMKKVRDCARKYLPADSDDIVRKRSDNKKEAVEGRRSKGEGEWCRRPGQVGASLLTSGR
jgi:hypothetical protein